MNDRESDRIDPPRAHPLGISPRRSGRLAALALFVAALAQPALAQPPPPPPPSDSQADSKSSDWFGTNSGWQYERRFLGNTAPVGNFSMEYKHWFNSPVAPPGWTTFASPPKPTAAAWNKVDDFKGNITTTSAAGSTAQSEWDIDPVGGGLGGFQAKIYTRSHANAVAPDSDAHSRTRVIDPSVYHSPATDPNWDRGNPLDPSGKWTFGGNIGLFGDIHGKGEIGLSYDLALNSTNPADAFPLLSVEVTDQGASIVAAPGLDLYSDGVPVTIADLTSQLDSYLTASGWSLDPGFDFAAYDPTNFGQVADIFDVEMRLKLDSSTTTATLFTRASSSADAIASVPEPTSLVLLGLGVAGAIAWSRRRRATVMPA